MARKEPRREQPGTDSRPEEAERRRPARRAADERPGNLAYAIWSAARQAERARTRAAAEETGRAQGRI